MTPEEHLAAALAGLGLGQDPEMARTPALVAELLRGFAPGAAPPEAAPLPTESRDLVVVRGLPFHSLCAHHLLPFFGHCTFAYRPSGRIVGLGWFPKLLQHLARQPQLQERLAVQLIDAVMGELRPAAAGVVLTARQLCVEMRGAASPGTFEVRALRGADDPRLEAALSTAPR